MLIVAASLVAAYYLLPAGASLPVGWWIALFASGLVLLAAAILVLIARMLAAGAEARLLGMFSVLCAAIVFFAESYYLLSPLPGQFAGLRTRTDSLYFTVTTLATVGFGDVHATGQLARAAVTLQIAFDLVFLAAAVSALVTPLRARAARRARQSGGPAQGGGRPE